MEVEQESKGEEEANLFMERDPGVPFAIARRLIQPPAHSAWHVKHTTHQPYHTSATNTVQSESGRIRALSLSLSLVLSLSRALSLSG